MALSNRKKVLFKYTLVLLNFLSVVGLIMGIIFVLSNVLEGPENLKYLHRGLCYPEEFRYKSNWCPTERENLGIFYQPDWHECELVEVVMSNTVESVNCTYIIAESFVDHLEARIAVRSMFTLGQNFSCVVDELQHFCYLSPMGMVTEILIITVPIAGIILFSLLTYCLYYKSEKNYASFELNKK